MQLTCLATCLAVVATSIHLTAGGPVQVRDGAACLWDATRPIPYRVDKGPLGSVPEPLVQQFVHDAFRTWASVRTASLRFAPGSLGEDVKSSIRFLAILDDRTSGNVVILDNHGGIIEAVYGVENAGNVLGFASPRVTADRITRFVALMNGALATDEATIRSTLVHELGHAIGLDHAQINAAFANNGDVDDDKFLPTMFPTATDDDATLVELNPDDVATVSRLYPGAGVQHEFGRITGVLVRADNSPVLGANVVASRLNGAAAEDQLQRYSCVSDYLMAGSGAFELLVSPGSYRLRIEPVRRQFGGGSSVGPYADTASAASFVRPVAPKQFSTVTVTAGGTTDVGVLRAQ